MIIVSEQFDISSIFNFKQFYRKLETKVDSQRVISLITNSTIKRQINQIILQYITPVSNIYPCTPQIPRCNYKPFIFSKISQPTLSAYDFHRYAIKQGDHRHGIFSDESQSIEVPLS